jgi:hypothetical protein
VASAAYGALTVLLVLVSDRLGLGRAAGFGYLLAAMGAGGVLATGVADRAAPLRAAVHSWRSPCSRSPRRCR